MGAGMDRLRVHPRRRRQAERRRARRHLRPLHPVPALLLGLAGLILALWYSLSRRRVEENVALLEERRGVGSMSV